ncbi:MAG TPA: xanthine dehydrogenase family protein subunit M [Hyphomicrobiaceae bacterium]
MKAPPLSYVRAATLSEAFQLWRDAGPDARLLAGGQSLLASLAFRLSDPGTLVDISRLRELRSIAQTGSATIRVGALTTHAELGRHELIRRHVPLLAEAVPLIAHPAIRNRGTLGGSLAFADPAAELPACCVALDAMIVARNAADERRIPAAQFFTGLYTTALKPYELIAAVEFPVAKRDERAAILELVRRSGDYAMAGVAAKARLAGTTLIEPQLVFFGVGDAPVVAERAMAAIGGQEVLPATVAAAQAALDAGLDPPADQHGGPPTKRHFARVLLARALGRLCGLDEAVAA